MQCANVFDANATWRNPAASQPNHYDQGRKFGSADSKLDNGGLLAQLSQDVGRLGERIAAGAQPHSYAAPLDNGPPLTRGEGVDV